MRRRGGSDAGGVWSRGDLEDMQGCEAMGVTALIEHFFWLSVVKKKKEWSGLFFILYFLTGEGMTGST